MTSQNKPNYSINLEYLLDCCNIEYTQQSYKQKKAIPQCDIGLSTLKKARSGNGISNRTAGKIARAFSLLLIHPENQRIYAEDLYLPPEDFKKQFPASNFIKDLKSPSYINMQLFTNKLYRCYYMVPNSPNSAYMGYFKLFEKDGYYHAYMVRGIQDFDLPFVSEIKKLFDTPESLAEHIRNKDEDKQTESIHLYEAWNDDSISNRREDITFTNNRIKIDFRSTEDDPCYSTMIWNTCIPNGMHLETYIGGSSLIVDTNDGKRGKNIHSFKMGLEAIEDIPASQKKIIKIGPLNRNSMRVIRELTLDSVDGLMSLDNSDDNRWYRFIQNDSYRSPKNTQYEDVNVEKLVESLILLKADYERQIDDLKNTIRELKKGEL